MSEESEAMTPGTRLLSVIEGDEGLSHILPSLDLTAAVEELLAAPSVLGGMVVLGDWAFDYPNTTGQLLRVIARDTGSSVKLAPMILGCGIVNSGKLSHDADEVLSAAFSELTGAWRDAAADRPGVRELLQLPEGVDYEAVPRPESSWLWPIGKPFPPAHTVEGAQARLNYLGRGCGPVTGEWNAPTRRALTRWQVDRGMDPTGELDDETIEELAHFNPAAPDR